MVSHRNWVRRLRGGGMRPWRQRDVALSFAVAILVGLVALYLPIPKASSDPDPRGVPPRFMGLGSSDNSGAEIPMASQALPNVQPRVANRASPRET